MNDIRCTTCRHEFTYEMLEKLPTNCCPNCKSVGVPMSINQDTTVKINWHELRILTMWATNFAEKECDVSSKKALASIIKELYNQKKEGFGSLTLKGEIEDLQKVFPNAEAFDSSGKLIVGKKFSQ